MDFSRGIPPESRTLVVVPTMLTSAAQIERLVEALEVRFLANRDEHLHFALLTDFADADEETLPEDEALALRRAATASRSSNAQVPQRASASSCSIARAAGIPASAAGWATSASAASSRELNALLRGGARRIASRSSSATTAVLRDVKYVITLDTDTQLPRDAARQLVGAMAHPLNRAALRRSRSA